MADVEQKRYDEMATVEQMIGIYCHHHHSTSGKSLCPACQDLMDYARKRVQYCPRMADKTFCSVCPTHCYAPARREKIKEVMRFSGPRMLFHSPIAAIRHMLIEHKYKRELKKQEKVKMAEAAGKKEER